MGVSFGDLNFLFLSPPSTTMDSGPDISFSKILSDFCSRLFGSSTPSNSGGSGSLSIKLLVQEILRNL